MKNEELVEAVSSLRVSLENQNGRIEPFTDPGLVETDCTIALLVAIEAALSLNMVAPLHNHVMLFAFQLMALCDRNIEEAQARN
jgi:hypothetical protein